MQRLAKRTYAFLIGIFASLYAANTASARPVQPYVPAKWLQIETDHFIIYSDEDRERTFAQVASIEQFRFFMDGLLPDSMHAVTARDQKLRLFLLRNPDDLSIVRPQFPPGVVGVYFACQEGASIYSSEWDSFVMNRKYFGQDQSQVTLYHEYTHHLMARKGLNHYPLWYIEGLAQYYSTLQYDGKQIAYGQVPYDVNFVLYNLSWGQFDVILDPAKLSSVKNLLDLAKFYDKAWLLTHYMMSDPDRRSRLDDYFLRLEHGESPVSAFETATHIPVASLPQTLRTYSKAFKINVTDAGEPPKMSGDVLELDDTFDSYGLVGSILDTCPTPKQGQWLLDTLKLQADIPALTNHKETEKAADRRAAWDWAIAEAPKLADDIDYRLTVAYAEILYGDPAGQQAFLIALPTSDEHYARAQYLLGRSYLAVAEKGGNANQGEIFAKAVQALSVAATAHHDDPAVQYYLAKALFNMDKDHNNKAVMQHAVAAYELAPSIIEYGTFAAYGLTLDGQRDKALEILSGFASDPHDLDSNKRVGDAITAISAGKPAIDIWQMLQPPKDKPAQDATKKQPDTKQ